MKKSQYVNFSEVTELQEAIMKFVDEWVHKEKVATPLKKIVEEMDRQGVKKPTVFKALHVLIQRGYLRRSITANSRSNMSYVQLRRV